MGTHKRTGLVRKQTGPSIAYKNLKLVPSDLKNVKENLEVFKQAKSEEEGIRIILKIWKSNQYRALSIKRTVQKVRKHFIKC